MINELYYLIDNKSKKQPLATHYDSIIKEATFIAASGLPLLASSQVS